MVASTISSSLTEMFVTIWSEKSTWPTWTATVVSGPAVNTILNTMPSRTKICNLGKTDGTSWDCGRCQNDGFAPSLTLRNGDLTGGTCGFQLLLQNWETCSFTHQHGNGGFSGPQRCYLKNDCIARNVWKDNLIPIRCNHATNHIQQGSHPSFPRKRESIRPPSVNTAASHRNGIRSQTNESVA